MTEIKKVAVIGAGVMGAGIAAQVANAGVPVLLLDIVPNNAEDRNTIANSALQKLKKSKPAAFMHPKNAKHITPGNIEDNLKALAECDWIIEAVIERLDIKQSLYEKIEKVRKKSAVVSSNTSTLPLAQLLKGMPSSFCKNFMITHFFNPPRYMRLLEVVTSPETDPKIANKINQFGDVMLGKSIVPCNDTPGFIANRIGTYWLHASFMKAMEHNIDVESADAVLGRPAGVPKTGVFGLLDLVGLDLVPHLLSSLSTSLPKEDAFHKLGPAPKLLDKLIKEGYTGRKGKGGFYRLGENKQKEALNLQTETHQPAKRPKVAAALAAKKGGLRALVTHNSPEGRYAWDVLSSMLAYSASLVPEIADNVETVDRAMRLGYNWKFGPFEMIDQLGTKWFATRLREEGRPVPAVLEIAAGQPFYKTHHGVKHYLTLEGQYVPLNRPKGVLLLEDIKRSSKPVMRNMSASLWDIGDGVACLEFHSKMNSLNMFTLAMINKTTKKLPKLGFKALVIHNEGTNFSVGANIAMLLVSSKLRLWPAMRYILYRGQMALRAMQNAPFPVVGAPSGMALGGGCEVLLHCNATTPHAESYVGLVEVGVGIIPGWGGCKEMLKRYSAEHPKGPMPQVAKSFEAIATAKVATSAEEAKKMAFFSADTKVVMNKDRVLFEAKQQALAMVNSYQPEPAHEFRLPGATGVTALTLAVNDFAKRGIATPHDVTIAKKLAFVLSGGQTDITETRTDLDILKLERDAIVQLAKTPQTRARIVHILKKGKPLRN